jgi:transposase
VKEQNILDRFYEGILGIPYSWKVVQAAKDTTAKEVNITLEYAEETYTCPVCGRPAKLYDHRIRKLRYLDTCDYKTMLEVGVPRITCPEHGVQQVELEFAEKHSWYTGMFEMMVIMWLQDEPISAVAEKLRMSWGVIAGIMGRGVRRGLERRGRIKPKAIGINERSYRKGHDYVTVILDKDNDRVLAVLPDRKSETILRWFKSQTVCDFSELGSISMDMSDGFIKEVKENFERWEELICFDRFHVSQHFNQGLDKMRRKEHGELADGKQCGVSAVWKSHRIREGTLCFRIEREA